jgi:hypothetical protein
MKSGVFQVSPATGVSPPVSTLLLEIASDGLPSTPSNAVKRRQTPSSAVKRWALCPCGQLAVTAAPAVALWLGGRPGGPTIVRPAAISLWSAVCFAGLS